MLSPRENSSRARRHAWWNTCEQDSRTVSRGAGVGPPAASAVRQMGQSGASRCRACNTAGRAVTRAGPAVAGSVPSSGEKWAPTDVGL